MQLPAHKCNFRWK